MAIPGAAQGKQIFVKAAKVAGEEGRLWGWASMSGVEDSDGDVISAGALREAAYQFLIDYRGQAAAIKLNHEDEADAVLIESALHEVGGLVGWWIGVQLLDEGLKQQAREGKISGFSIGGSGRYEEV